MTCPLCTAAPLTPRVHQDDLCWVADCEQCQVPMVVWSTHGSEPPPAERARMLEALDRVAVGRFGPGGFGVDELRRTIPAHWHAHARARIVRDRAPFVPEANPVLGWRYWGDLESTGEGVRLVAPSITRSAVADRGDGCWSGRWMTAEPCWLDVNVHEGGFGPLCCCGLFAYASLEDLAITCAGPVPAVTLVAGHGPVHWSISDHERGRGGLSG